MDFVILLCRPCNSFMATFMIIHLQHHITQSSHPRLNPLLQNLHSNHHQKLDVLASSSWLTSFAQPTITYASCSLPSLKMRLFCSSYCRPCFLFFTISQNAPLLLFILSLVLLVLYHLSQMEMTPKFHFMQSTKVMHCPQAQLTIHSCKRKFYY